MYKEVHYSLVCKAEEQIHEMPIGERLAKYIVVQAQSGLSCYNKQVCVSTWKGL